MTGVARAGADGGDGGVAVPLPLDWAGGGEPSGWLAAEPRVLREVATRIRGLAADGSPGPEEAFAAAWRRRGVSGDIRDLGEEPGAWPTGRLVQHLHSQLRAGVTGFHGALVAGLPAVAARLELSAATYQRTDQVSGQRIDQAGAGVLAAPSAVGPDGRF